MQVQWWWRHCFVGALSSWSGSVVLGWEGAWWCWEVEVGDFRDAVYGCAGCELGIFC